MHPHDASQLEQALAFEERGENVDALFLVLAMQEECFDFVGFLRIDKPLCRHDGDKDETLGQRTFQLLKSAEPFSFRKELNLEQAKLIILCSFSNDSHVVGVSNL